MEKSEWYRMTERESGRRNDQEQEEEKLEEGIGKMKERWKMKELIEKEA